MKIVAVLLVFFLTIAGHAAAVPAPQSHGAEDFADFHDPFEEPADRASEVPDPLEIMNRGAFWANDKIYTYLLQPFCETVPEKIREAISDGVEWLMTPVRVAHMELNFTFRDAGSELGRFALRGLLTLLERTHPAATASVAGGQEDFDRAFEHMGFEPGIYLILPVLGPSTLRDGLGRLTSLYVDAPFHLRPGGRPVPRDESIEDEMKTYAAIRESALDPYLFIRDAYQQQRMARKNETSQQASAGRLIRGSVSKETGIALL